MTRTRRIARPGAPDGDVSDASALRVEWGLGPAQDRSVPMTRHEPKRMQKGPGMEMESFDALTRQLSEAGSSRRVVTRTLEEAPA